MPQRRPHVALALPDLLVRAQIGGRLAQRVADAMELGERIEADAPGEVMPEPRAIERQRDRTELAGEHGREVARVALHAGDRVARARHERAAVRHVLVDERLFPSRRAQDEAERRLLAVALAGEQRGEAAKQRPADERRCKLSAPRFELRAVEARRARRGREVLGRACAAAAPGPGVARLGREPRRALLDRRELVRLERPRLAGGARPALLLLVDVADQLADLLGVDAEHAVVEPALVAGEREPAGAHDHPLRSTPGLLDQLVADAHVDAALLRAFDALLV